MIDTVKIYSMISKSIYKTIYDSSIIKTSYNNSSGELYYTIVNNKLEGSYSSSLSVRVGDGAKYGFINNYYIEIEGSYHKIAKGYNSHNGYYNLLDICISFIDIVNGTYNIKLPSFLHWFLQRVDIAVCFDLENNSNVSNYINSLSLCNYPRRNLKHYQDESIYLTGCTTTLKIYNKLLEFKKHDMKKFFNSNFDLVNYIKRIDGFIRFECEIKKKKLKDIYNKKHLRINTIFYSDLKNIWGKEFMKLIKLFENDLKIVKNREDVYKRLLTLYDNKKANILYNFYTSVKCDGLRQVKNRTTKSTYYRNLKELKGSGIDFSQSYDLHLEESNIYFNPFEYKEVV